MFHATKQRLVQFDKGTENISLEHHKWRKNTSLIARHSITSGIEDRISRQWRKVKVKSLPGAKIQKIIISKNTIILHIGTSNTFNETSKALSDKLLFLKAFVEKDLRDYNVYSSNLTLRADNAKASLTVNASTNKDQKCSMTSLIIVLLVMLDRVAECYI